MHTIQLQATTYELAAGYPGVKHEEPLTSPVAAKTLFSFPDLANVFRSQPTGLALNAPITEDDMITVRRIRAYTAQKI